MKNNVKHPTRYRPHAAIVLLAAVLLTTAALYVHSANDTSAVDTVALPAAPTSSPTVTDTDDDDVSDTASVPVRLSSAASSVAVEGVTATESAENAEVAPTVETAPTEEQLLEQRIAEELSQMTAREKLGQMFMIAYSAEAETVIADNAFGAVIFFASDFENETVEGIREKTSALQSSSRYGVLTAVDEEGGTVTRVSRYGQFRSEKYLSPRTLYSWGGMEAIRSDAIDKAELLTSLGLNLNMAPVADISTSESDFMYWRSVGLDAEGTSEFVRTVIDESRSRGLGSVVKHFPGYGSVADTHTGIAYDGRTLEELRERDLVPFAAAIEEGAEAILVSHIITPAIDEKKPASVSEAAVALLRDELGYEGVIMTDDLAMSGITDYCTNGNAALEAILAGCDLLCCTNWAEQYPLVWAAVEDGTITSERLDLSVARILRLKHSLGLWVG